MKLFLKASFMKKQQWLYEIICFILILNFFYEGIYKIAHFNSYSFWVTHTPVLHHVAPFLKYFVPLAEVAASVMILTPYTRNAALYSIIIGEVAMILWVVYTLIFTGWLIFPFYTLWNNPNWMEKMLYALLLSWLALTVILLANNKTFDTKNLLRNTSANVN
jgi:hypothetical protein